ncbi:MAG TPA: S8 family serine peptidase [Flavitalea sp.]|nr:S8 family serine peptidase [Flavitalea sp.]
MKKGIVYYCSFISSLLIILVLAGCKPQRNKPGYSGKSPYVPKQLVVLFNERTTQDQIAKFRIDVQQKYKQLRYKQCHCNIKLELWEGDNIEALLRDTSLIKGEIAQTSRTGVREDGDSVSVSLNLINNVRDGSKGPQRMDYKPNSEKGNTLVAILDTGLDTALFTHQSLGRFLVSPRELPLDCKTDNLFAGWNFVDSNANFTDNHPRFHGTNVTALVLNEADKSTIRILPLKTHGKDGTGTLFDAICAMKYAKKAGAKILNASWGEYGQPNAVFERTLDELQESNMLFVAAAGNDNRDISLHPFFPASYSMMNSADRHPNVISVTTVKETAPCSNNFSTQHVDVGAVGRGSCSFETPFGGGHTVSGSSFATPVITGKIADGYNHPGGDTKANILAIMNLETTLHLIPKIRTGDGFKQR